MIKTKHKQRKAKTDSKRVVIKAFPGKDGKPGTIVTKSSTSKISIPAVLFTEEESKILLSLMDKVERDRTKGIVYK